MSCPFCEKVGLPILPVRYALARADQLGAPVLQSQFSQSVPLPSASAQYTLRVLREGYLYVYEAGIDLWSAYVVTEQGYLYKFEIQAKSPPDMSGKQPCSGGSDPYAARCITIHDLPSATYIQLVFSDVMWTSGVLNSHQDAAYRSEHMRRIDVKQWVTSGGSQAHAAALDEVGKHVAEFARPFDERAPEVPLLKSALGRYNNYAVQTLEKQAFSFSLYTFQPLGKQTEPLQTWAQATSTDMAKRLKDAGDTKIKQIIPMIVGLDDAVAITVDLNSLIPQRLAEWFVKDKNRKWRYGTSMTIQMLEQAVKKQAVEERYHSRASRVDREWGQGKNSQFAGMQWSSAVGQRLEKELVRARTETDAQAGELGDEAWKKYRKVYKESERINDDAAFKAALKAFDASTITPLSKAYLAWFDSQPFKCQFSHNHDPKDADSGRAYTALAELCVKDACGRADVLEKFKTYVTAEPEDRSNVILRAMFFNQDELEAALKETDALPDGQKVPWMGMARTLNKGLARVLGPGLKNSGQFDGALHGLAGYVYQVAGPVAAALGKALDGGLVGLGKMLPQKRLLAMLAHMSWKEGDPWHFLPVQSDMTPSQTTRSLANMAAELSAAQEGHVTGQIRGVVQDAYNRTASSEQGVTHKVRAIAFMNTENARAVGALPPDASRSTRSAAVGAAFAFGDQLTPPQMDEVLRQTIRNSVSTEFRISVVGLILGAWALHANWHEQVTEGTLNTEAKWSVAALGTAGSMGEIVGMLSKHTTFGMVKLNKPIKSLLLKAGTRADLLQGVGKLVGAGTGILLGFWMFGEGMMEYGANHSLGLLHMASGFLTAALGSILLITSWITAGVGLVLFLVIALITYVASFFVDDKFQAWLRKCYYGDKTYTSYEVQNAAFEQLTEQTKSEPSAYQKMREHLLLHQPGFVGTKL